MSANFLYKKMNTSPPPPPPLPPRPSQSLSTPWSSAVVAYKSLPVHTEIKNKV